MSETINEFHLCICGRGEIKLIKKEYITARNEIKESYVDIFPCPFCGRKIDNNGNDLSKLF
ncbi:hypothetical protein [Methanobacterium spitsbergense]|uniref:Uncharacterized protein n=1 Tax=Methanobacterium spitsbergense TaxID=2874285 RepID=A0A8T5V0Q9_9EURY|nr:hypothetical protein [Methanobacterium spitsbergense]MBZ2167030.1 hypothetical protein [Methanobacterium spitsbergense]